MQEIVGIVVLNRELAYKYFSGFVNSASRPPLSCGLISGAREMLSLLH